MADLTPSVPDEPTRMSVERYFGLAEAGALTDDDRVELLEGLVVAMTPRTPVHDSCVTRATLALVRAVAGRAVVRTQCSLIAGRHSVPEPDVAVVPGLPGDYDSHHPDAALLVVEVAESSLQQDRITKAAIYAAAGVPEYWLVNLRDGRLEVSRDPDRGAARYRDAGSREAGERVEIQALPGALVAVADLLPRPR